MATDNMDIFTLLGEVAIGIIGFAAIVTVLGRSSLTEEVRAFRLRMLFINASMCLWGAFAPLIATLFVEPPAAWMAAALMYGALAIPFNLVSLARIVNLAIQRQIGLIGVYVIMPVNVVTLVFLVAAIVWFNEFVLQALALSIVFFVFIALFHFFQLVNSLRSEAQS